MGIISSLLPESAAPDTTDTHTLLRIVHSQLYKALENIFGVKSQVIHRGWSAEGRRGQQCLIDRMLNPARARQHLFNCAARVFTDFAPHHWTRNILIIYQFYFSTTNLEVSF